MSRSAGGARREGSAVWWNRPDGRSHARTLRAGRFAWPVVVVLFAGCDAGETGVLPPIDDSADAVDTDPSTAPWSIPASDLGGALLSITGTAWDDVWVVGADDGLGPTVGHHDGAAWSRLATGSEGDLWWAWQPPPAPLPSHRLWAVGEGGRVLRYDGAAWDETVTDPTLTLFGVWGATEDEVWAVGGSATARMTGAMFRWDGAAWSEVVLPPEAADVDAVYKVWGSAADDVWACGTGGVVLHFDGAAWTRVDVGTDQLLLTVAGSGRDNVVAVGGFGNARVVRFDGAAWTDESPDFVADMNGVSVRGDAAVMVGRTGAVYRRGADGLWVEDPRGRPEYDDLHAAWIDPDGAVWAVGGAFASLPMVRGLIVYGGRRPVAAWTS